ncbi:hypothetical protein MYCOZU1_05933 (plasmid) [Mycobacterium intracellulare subsp. chimaera]|uniref:hypothetical protein n=1 Tax=Mycobacterium intracellulare TaxID=1767 RepID=UPI000B5DB90E|nr:hypothetical protein [Mycobacterium intracellulare]ASL24293.1 hypothetical protein MYCOZU1_05933 [Mycobacterium intracellulare subsp. chimaera]
MDEDDSRGEQDDCEPNDSGPCWESVVPPVPLPVVTSVADQLIGKTWLAGPEMKFDNFLAGSPAVRSAMDALVPSASEAALGMSKLIGGEYLEQVGADARFKLTDLWAKAAGPVWPELRTGPGLGAELAAAAADRAREAMGDLGLGVSGLSSHIAGAASPFWEGLQPPVSDLATSFLPAGPQSSVVSAFTAGLAGKGLAGPDLGSFAGLDVGSPSRFFLADHLQNSGMPDFSNGQWPWSKRLGASVFDGVTAAMHRHAQGLSSWMETTHQAAMDALWRAPEQSIAAMLQSFSTLADQGVAWGWRALGAALRAQRAVLRGDLEAIARFLLEWLGFKKTPHTLVDAASAVLLEEEAWLPAGLAGDDKLCPLIKKLTVRQHRNFRPLGDTQLCGRSVDSLDRKVKISRDEAVRVPLVELVPAPPPPPSEDDISDPRLVWIMDRLTEREQQIVRMKAKGAHLA